jgi:2'-5' RNA ligase
MIRLFAALHVPEEFGLALQKRQHGIDNARWRPLDALHVTLRFYGEIREDLARDLDEQLLGLRHPPFEITLAGAGAFGEGADLHAVWAGVEPTEPLTRLARACEAAARRVGLKADTRTYRPHVTLAYLNRPDPRQVAAWIQTHNLLKSPPIGVESFALYSSTLGKEGSKYQAEAVYGLSADAARLPREPAP